MITGWSISISSESGLNSVVAPAADSIARDVPTPQPSGTVTLGWTVMSAAAAPCGYIVTSCQFRTACLGVVAGPAPNEPLVGPRYSVLTSIRDTPGGTST